MKRPEDSAPHTTQQKTADNQHELVRRIRKLRWIGKEDEATALQKKLAGKKCRESVLVLPAETD